MIRSIIESHLSHRDEYIFGFANLTGFLPRKFSHYHYGISIGKKLDDTITDNLKKGPTLEYYFHYNQVNRELSEMSAMIHADLKRNNIHSFPVIPTISIGSEHYKRYLKTLTYDISHKLVATRAGLGWIGKTDLLISFKFGPRLRLTTILLEQNPGCQELPVEESKCGDCNLCVIKCPAQAANGLLWNTGIHRDLFFDARKCREKCGELAKKMLNVDERICGLCVSVCPKGKIRN